MSILGTSAQAVAPALQQDQDKLQPVPSCLKRLDSGVRRNDDIGVIQSFPTRRCGNKKAGNAGSLVGA
jgi:hypothetical protein